MAEEQMDMSLDDIIKAKPSMVKRGRSGGRGGGRARGGGGGGGGRGSGNRSRGAARPAPYSRETPNGRWRHDKFEGGRMSGGGGGRDSTNVDRGITKLLISNLEYSVNDQDIRELFTEFGPIKTYSVHYDRSGRSLGTADVTYLYKADATRALKTYNDVPLDGKPMRIELVADEVPFRQSFGSGGGGGGGGGFNRNRGGGRGMGSRGRSSNRGSSRGGGRGRGGSAKKPMTAEELDKQLDDYKNKA